MLEISINFIEQLLSPIFYIFICLVSINFIWIFYVYRKGENLLSYWNKLLLTLNEESGEMSDEEIENVKTDAIAYPLVAEMINRLTELSKKTKGLSLVEIHEIIEPSINRSSSKLNQGAGNFIILGLLFTVLGLLLGLFNLKEFNAEAITLLLNNLQVAFTTTILGVIFAIIPKISQMKIEALSENFRYQFTLFARNKLIPHYSIRNAEKDLGEVVRQIEISSIELKKAATSVLQLSQNTELSTSRVEEAVRGFADITEKMTQREDDLIKSLSQISRNLSATQSTIEGVFIPTIDQLKQDLLNRDINIESNIKVLAGLQESQSKLNDNIDNAMLKLIKTNKEIGKFFNEKFETSFKSSMDQLNDTYDIKIQKLISDIKTLSDTMVENTNKSEIERNNDYTNIKNSIESQLSGIKEKIDSYKFSSEDIINNINNQISKTKNQELNQYSELKVINNKMNENIELANRKIDEISKEVNVLKKDNINGISKIISKVGNHIKDIESQFKDMKKIEEGKPENTLSKSFGQLKKRFSNFNK